MLPHQNNTLKNLLSSRPVSYSCNSVILPPPSLPPSFQHTKYNEGPHLDKPTLTHPSCTASDSTFVGLTLALIESCPYLESLNVQQTNITSPNMGCKEQRAVVQQFSGIGDTLSKDTIIPQDVKELFLKKCLVVNLAPNCISTSSFYVCRCHHHDMPYTSNTY